MSTTKLMVVVLNNELIHKTSCKPFRPKSVHPLKSQLKLTQFYWELVLRTFSRITAVL